MVCEGITSVAMDICLVEVPYHAGDDGHPSSSGAQRLIEAGAVELFAERGLAVASATAATIATPLNETSPNGVVCSAMAGGPRRG